MISRLLRGLRSNAVAILALTLALGGTAYATSKIGAADIRRDAIKARHVAKGAIGGDQIRDGAVGLSDVDGLPRLEASKSQSQSFGNYTPEFGVEPPNGFDELAFGECSATPASAFDCTQATQFLAVNQPGVYAVDARVNWEPDPDGDRYLYLTAYGAGGEDDVTDVQPAGSGVTTSQISTTFEIAGADAVIQVEAAQSSGGSLGLSTAYGAPAELNVQYLGPVPG